MFKSVGTAIPYALHTKRKGYQILDFYLAINGSTIFEQKDYFTDFRSCY